MEQVSAYGLNVKQCNALRELQLALQRASTCGLLDNLDLNPDVTNLFCDTVSDLCEKEFKTV